MPRCIAKTPHFSVELASWASKSPKQTSAFKPRYTQGLFDVFKTVRICISGDAQDSLLSCSLDSECKDEFVENVSEVKEVMENAPDFVKVQLNNVLENAIYCEGTCKMKKIYGEGFGEGVEICNAGDEEILLEIRGKEGLEILKYMRKNSGKFE